ncbi:MAG TPA: hypothetical protein PKM78_09955 [Anaerolineae bacterium]|nr:hypothetical protein [Anaerolineae bacterium]HNU02556.1 hypothetical protein [Anaerolineae bacterium]
MISEEIRARIAQLEAEAEQRAQAEAGRSSHAADDDPWQRLFDAPWASSAGLENDDFSLNGWLAEGLAGLRAYLRGAGLNDEFWLHMRGAERELLLAARALIDARLELVEARGRKAEQASRLQEIEIDF